MGPLGTALGEAALEWGRGGGLGTSWGEAYSRGAHHGAPRRGGTGVGAWGEAAGWAHHGARPTVP